MSTERSISLGRRALIRSLFATPALVASASAARRTVSPGVDWGKWFHDWFGRDFGMIGYYSDDNARLLASREPVDIVFLGDSITEGWRDARPAFFQRGRINRGISGQTTPQMLLRMYSDVVALRPKAVHIMAGTNDIAGNTGPMTAEMSEDNFSAMTDIAHRHGIHVLLAPVPPAASYPWQPKVQTRPRIAELNQWLERFARRSGATWVDYRRVLDDGTGAMKHGLADDGVHPNGAGYDAMASVIEPILQHMFRRSRRA